MKIEISTRKVRKGMKVLATSSTKEVSGIVNDIGHSTFGVYDGEQTWGFFFDEPCKAKVYLLSKTCEHGNKAYCPDCHCDYNCELPCKWCEKKGLQKVEYCECEKCPHCGKLLKD